MGDRARLAQIVCNLLDNASKYTPDGGEIRLSLEVLDDAAVLTVSDNGIGITAQALPDIFEPFAHDIQALGFNGVGRGIGLATVRALVKAHGGTVRAYSEGSMLGSRFVVTLALPAAADAVRRAPPLRVFDGRTASRRFPVRGVTCAGVGVRGEPPACGAAVF